MLTVKDQIKFFDWQLNEIALTWEAYLHSTLSALLNEAKAFTGELAGIDQARGNVIFKFPANGAPRLNTPYSLYLYKQFNGSEQLNFDIIRFRDFRVSGFCHFRENSDLIPIYYLEGEDDNFRYIGCANCDLEVFEKFETDLAAGRKTKILLGEKEPPYQFFLNLKSYVSSNSNHNEELKGLSKTYYNQYPLKGSDNLLVVQGELNVSDLVILQGPPGTGKSTLTAELVELQVRKGNSVCITALSNKALTEIAAKRGIQQLSKDFRICKTALTSNEAKDLPFVENSREIMATQNGVLLTTYYKLSQHIVHGERMFDLLIIEEASQAFLPVIRSFMRLAAKTLIIGDPMQLSPIVLNEGYAETVHREVRRLINGLDTVMRLNHQKSFLLTESFRLSPFNAALTGNFYQGQLSGRALQAPNLKLMGTHQEFFDPLKPHQLLLMEDLIDRQDLEKTSEFLRNLLVDMISQNPHLSISILTPFKKDVLFLQQDILSAFKEEPQSLIIETIDKVQGLTVDVCILILTINANPTFIFNENRINVATSRARYYNLTITDRRFEMLSKGISNNVRLFFSKLPTLHFKS